LKSSDYVFTKKQEELILFVNFASTEHGFSSLIDII